MKKIRKKLILLAFILFGINTANADIEVQQNFGIPFASLQSFNTGGTITSKYVGGYHLKYSGCQINVYKEDGTFYNSYGYTSGCGVDQYSYLGSPGVGEIGFIETELYTIIIPRFRLFRSSDGGYTGHGRPVILVFDKYNYNNPFYSIVTGAYGDYLSQGFYVYNNHIYIQFNNNYYTFEYGSGIVNLGATSLTIQSGTLLTNYSVNYFGGGNDIVYIDTPRNTFGDRTFLVTDGTILSASEQVVPLPLNNTDYTHYFIPIVDLAFVGGNGGAGLSFINKNTGAYSSYNFYLGQWTYNASKYWYNMDYVNKTYLELADYGTGTSQTPYSLGEYNMNLIWKVTTSNLGSTENMYYTKDGSNSLWLRSDTPPVNNAVGGGGGGTTGTTGTNTTQPTNQTCTEQTFEINSGTGSNEIIYNDLTYSNMVLSSSGSPIFGNYLSEQDNLNLFNDTQLTFSGSFPDLATLKDLYLDYLPIGTNYPKEIEFYIGNAINANYSTPIIEAVLFKIDGTKETKTISNTFFGSSYKVSLSNLGYITKAQIRITGTQNKIPSLQKIKFYGDKQRETKTRYQCTSGTYNCNWTDYFTAKMTNYCEVSGDYNYVKPEFLEKKETTDNSWVDSIGNFFNSLGSAIGGRIDGVKNAIGGIGSTLNGSGSTGNTQTAFGSGNLGDSLGTGSLFTISFTPGTAIINTGGLDSTCKPMFDSNGNFTYMGNRTLAFPYQSINYLESLGMERWVLTIFGVNILGWAYDLTNWLANLIPNTLKLLVEKVLVKIDFIFNYMSIPTREANYCFFGKNFYIESTISSYYSYATQQTISVTGKNSIDIIVRILLGFGLLFYIIRRK